ncbi:MAG: hypothetical protein D6801_04715 [Alphaproteobacteria bacterium]|nr:MAG: hypothetical protein D6801_04715 [Alphaproteobacteria bacterium]
MRPTLVLLLTLALALPLAAPASTLAPNRGKVTRAGAPEASDTRQFVEANIVETLYHELAHVLIDVLDLPVFGPEEFAADSFSVVLMNRMHDERTVLRMARDVAAVYDANAREAGSSEATLALWDVHGPDRQRFYNFVCLMFGARPDARRMFAEGLGLPKERRKTCEEEYAQADRAWGAVLERLAAEAPGDALTMDWMLDAGNWATRFVAGEVDRLNARMAIPGKVSVSVIPCGESNAFYDSGPREIIICTEMIAELESMAEHR